MITVCATCTPNKNVRSQKKKNELSKCTHVRRWIYSCSPWLSLMLCTLIPLRHPFLSTPLLIQSFCALYGVSTAISRGSIPTVVTSCSAILIYIRVYTYNTYQITHIELIHDSILYRNFGIEDQ